MVLASEFLLAKGTFPATLAVGLRQSHVSPARSVAPTEVRCEFLKSSLFVVAVFLWSNRVIIRINMHREVTRNPHMVPWGWGEGVKDEKNIFLSLIFHDKNKSI